MTPDMWFIWGFIGGVVFGMAFFAAMLWLEGS